MAEYVQLDLIGDVDTLTNTGKTYMEQSFGDNWVSRPGNPETILIEGAGQIAGELIDQAATVPPEAMAYIGTSIYGVPMNEGTRAVGQATITFAPDTGAVMVPLNSEVAVPHPSGNNYIYLTDRDAIAPAGGGAVPVQVVALDEGEEFNGAFGDSELVDAVAGVIAVTVQPTGGGVDAESIDEYLGRLVTILQVPRRPVRPEDHVRLALQVPGVERASVYNLYYPGTDARDAGMAVGDFDIWQPQPPPAAPIADVERCTTVAITAEGGAEPNLQLMQDVYAYLDANREVTFLNFVMKPTYTSVDVRAQVRPYAGTIQADAIAAAEEMLRTWLSPETWNANPTGEGGAWNVDSVVRLYEAVDFINRAYGVWYTEGVEMKLSSEPDTAWRAADIALPGLAPVPTYGDILVVGITA